ncbi:Trk system potassium transporter TrkA [Methylophaga sp. OBS4]|uniref:Trk system potassium transporter TrkA n=1 Tax=Methylophaga sp. OBS4 TaxID=2991935 RepID=UPI00224F5CE9|nr:Trk system potassium transporter TrkA [Methylophaga sp. OBS4]MCX4186894.1 Trk system potassium transporter TrkA [Methylophaga sp. OBS4]
MKIIILGAGQVGVSVARNLVNEANDITVVDHNQELLSAIQDQLDIKTVCGHGSQPDVLLKAGIEDADMILAATSSDETNMVACHIAQTLFHTPTRLARVRAPAYLTHPEIFSRDAIPIDFLISPEQLVTTLMQHLIDQPEVTQVSDFFGGKARLVAVTVHQDSRMTGLFIRDLAALLPGVGVRIAAIFRKNTVVSLDGSTLIQADDEIFFLAESRDIPRLVRIFRHKYSPYNRIIIAGGGNIGKQLAEKIEDRFKVKIIEHRHDRCRYLAENLHNTIVLQGDVGDAELLKAENIDQTDVYCAVTNDEEANILSCMLAKRLGARKTFSIINRPSHVGLVHGTAIDIAVSPAQVTIGALLTHIRRGDVVAVHSLRWGAAEAIEVIAHGDRETSQVVGRAIKQLPLPKDTTIGAILREEQLIFPDGETVIQSEDHVVLFLSHYKDVQHVEKLFQVGFTFL